MMGHAYSLDERLIRLPCAAAGPGANRVGEIASLASLPAAIGRAAELADHPWTDASPDGIGVAQFNAPAGPEDPRMRKALQDWGLGDEALPRITTDFACATDGRFKLVRREPVGGDAEEEVFDLRSDPLEAHPVSADSPPDAAAIERLRAALEAPVEGVAPAPADDAMEISDAEREALERRMELLGYL
jgi:arylsulfatase A-like enzyme